MCELHARLGSHPTRPSPLTRNFKKFDFLSLNVIMYVALPRHTDHVSDYIKRLVIDSHYLEYFWFYLHEKYVRKTFAHSAMFLPYAVL